jgi:hypothetical protein
MKETKCEAIRRELDELTLGDECGVDATRHLQQCGECRDFHQKQTRLRQIVGGLGTVAAPPDFDFRLRARLANESNTAGFHLRVLQWPFATKGVAVAAVLLLFVVGAVLVRRNMVNQESNREPQVAVRDQEPARPAPGPIEIKEQTPFQPAVVASHDGPRKSTGERTAQPKRTMVAVDRASEGASVFSDSQQQAAIFPIDASLQSLRVSIDDGHGNARTISVPTISFGSQRVLATGNQLAPKGVW